MARAGDGTLTMSRARGRRRSMPRGAPADTIGMVGAPLWIALLRVVVGAWFLKAVWTKLTIAMVWGIPYPAVAARFVGFQPKRVAEFAAGNPIGWYKDFLEQTVLPHASVFA